MILIKNQSLSRKCNQSIGLINKILFKLFQSEIKTIPVEEVKLKSR